MCDHQVLSAKPPAKLRSDRFRHVIVSSRCAKKIYIEICPVFGIGVDNCGRCRCLAALLLLDIALFSGVVCALYVTSDLLVVPRLVGFGRAPNRGSCFAQWY